MNSVMISGEICKQKCRIIQHEMLFCLLTGAFFSFINWMAFFYLEVKGEQEFMDVATSVYDSWLWFPDQSLKWSNTWNDRPLDWSHYSLWGSSRRVYHTVQRFHFSYTAEKLNLRKMENLLEFKGAELFLFCSNSVASCLKYIILQQIFYI